MKTFTTKIAAPLLLVFFVIGLVTFADAAFPGKKEQAKELSVAKTGTDSNLATTPALPATDESTLLLVILCFLLPPLAVYLKYGEINTPFWVNVILTLLCGLPGIIHALIHVLRK